jgi:hypothetical protein
MAPLLPPSSRMARPRRAATRGASSRPMAVEPVAESTGRRRSPASSRASSEPPIRTSSSPAGASAKPAAARPNRASQARAVRGVRGEGFHTTGLPQTQARAAFQAHTAAGKLKAETTPTGPMGCHSSIRRWPGRSLGRVRPPSWRDRPTAKSQMSIISWTSPRPSWRILPVSRVMSSPNGALACRRTWA